MSKKILLYIDPLDLTPSMLGNRFRIFMQLASILSSSGYSVQVYGFELSKLIKSKAIPSIEIVDCSPSVSILRGYLPEYNSLLFSNALPHDLVEIIVESLLTGVRRPDIVISNVPSEVVSKAFPEIPILHYELGMFNRAPFPIMHRLDPLGFHHKGLLSMFPSFFRWKTSNNLENILMTLRSRMISTALYDVRGVGDLDAVYVPLYSNTNWTSRIEISAASRSQYLGLASKKFATHTLLVNEKPQSPLTKEEIEQISSLPNVSLIQNIDQMGVGSSMVMRCKAVYSFSPSMVLQALFWGNECSAPAHSSMYAWTSLNSHSRLGALGLYLSKFQFSSSKGFLRIFLDLTKCFKNSDWDLIRYLEHESADVSIDMHLN